MIVLRGNRSDEEESYFEVALLQNLGENMSETMFELLYTIDSLLRIVFMFLGSIAFVKYLIRRKNE